MTQMQDADAVPPDDNPSCVNDPALLNDAERVVDPAPASDALFASDTDDADDDPALGIDDLPSFGP